MMPKKVQDNNYGNVTQYLAVLFSFVHYVIDEGFQR